MQSSSPWVLMLALAGAELPNGGGYRFVEFGTFTKTPGIAWGPLTDHLGRPIPWSSLHPRR